MVLVTCNRALAQGDFCLLALIFLSSKPVALQRRTKPCNPVQNFVCLINYRKYRSIETWMIDFMPLIIS
nr:MAG TPA: hypothetical protein [Caudoviricetes sp.]